MGAAENNPPSLDGTNLRSCGGHLHIGFDRAKNDMMARPHLVRILDLVAGVPSIIIDKDKDRRKLYGKAGAHRPKMIEAGDPYDGVEYRTLSNFGSLLRTPLVGHSVPLIVLSVTLMSCWRLPTNLVPLSLKPSTLLIRVLLRSLSRNLIWR